MFLIIISYIYSNGQVGRLNLLFFMSEQIKCIQHLYRWSKDFINSEIRI